MKRVLRPIFAVTLSLVFALVTATTLLAQSAQMFGEGPPLRVNANNLVVEFQSPPPREYPHVGHRAPVTFEQAVNIWANGHFQLTGAGENTLRITVREADIVENLLPVKKGIAGWFRKDQAAKYTANLDISVTLVDANGQQQGSAEAKSMNSITVEEGATDADKQAVWLDMIKKTFTNFNREIEPRIRSTFANHVQ